MRNSNKRLFAAGLLAALLILGCGQRSQNSEEAIQLSKGKTTVEAQVKFLIQEANGFINSEKFDEAINTAKYILSNLDANSAEAQNVIERAKAELQNIANQKIQEVQSSLGSFGR